MLSAKRRSALSFVSNILFVYFLFALICRLRCAWQTYRASDSVTAKLVKIYEKLEADNVCLCLLSLLTDQGY